MSNIRKILFIHNFYRSSAPSGEDTVAINERYLLEQNGIEVTSFVRHNDDLDSSSLLNRISLAVDCIYSLQVYSEIQVLLDKVQPDIAHIHSLHPQISPSVYAACQDRGVPVVHTLHNYRYICPGALLLRNGVPCEECVNRLPFKALRNRCYRDSLTATGAVALMIAYNRMAGSFKIVDRYIALTAFAKSRFVAGGFPADRIDVKPNYLPSPPVLEKKRGNHAVYVGRLSEEKGLGTLIKAWRSVGGLPLKVLGDGPLRPALERQTKELKLDIEFMGSRSRDEVLAVVGNALFQLVPSVCYEGFPMVVLEAFASGTPVIASRIGSLAEIVHDGETGLHFEAGNPADLARKASRLASSPDLVGRMGAKARSIFEQNYTAEQSFRMLMEIYEHASESFRKRKHRRHAPGN